MASNRQVRYVDFGFTSAQEFWREVAVPAHNRFTAIQNRQTAIDASGPAWHIHDWVWHENNPGVDTQGNPGYRAFRDGLIVTCPELAWVRDIADAGKHRGLGRPGKVDRMSTRDAATLTFNGKPLTFNGAALTFGGGLEIELTDGTRYQVATVLNTVIAFWEAYFATAAPTA